MGRALYSCADMSSPAAAPDLAKSSKTESQPGAESTTEVYAIHGAEPEVLAYAMAKYSRSALTMRESLVEISSQKAEQFLNTFYFQYGHRSIADLAHIPFAVERLSLLAAIALVDETRWDGQERSTRYQNFRQSGWYTPELSKGARKKYAAAVEALFHAYEELGAGMFEALQRAVPRPEEMKPESVCADAEGAGVRCCAVYVAAGDEHVAGPDCECADAGDAGFAAALE